MPTSRRATIQAHTISRRARAGVVPLHARGRCSGDIEPRSSSVHEARTHDEAAPVPTRLSPRPWRTRRVQPRAVDEVALARSFAATDESTTRTP
jgi:hypothetical protein